MSHTNPVTKINNEIWLHSKGNALILIEKAIALVLINTKKSGVVARFSLVGFIWHQSVQMP